jgi:DNA-binding HxlR family transcriptional regulator
MNRKCPIYNVMTFVGKRWTILVLCELHKGRKKWKRYSEIKRKLPGMTPKMLSARFKELESEGLIKHRVDASNFPVKSEYRLTPKGDDFIKVIMDMKKWGLKWKIKNEHCESVNCKYCEL